ncbi:Retrovirus-related Pol polyprotein from transposon TNT 1-94 [Vitis vinifera]|uniref:Retrovirus-related Pol polyprotein from transposon TNT 1-94 n=1 Tax=Vitis vinifera TaxID=29760 RepID=A0A438GMX8_VITVI|nr:Retrovirus-related Pol polyprotein from transposon TNT 1-94 [Vitis vinifera]
MKRDYPKKKKEGSVSENKESSSKSANVVAEEDSESGDGDMLSVSSSSNHLTDSWILDSACSYHMTPKKDWFNTYRSVNSGSVLMGNDASCKVAGIRNIIIKMFDGVVRTSCDVRHVPDLRKNRISLGTLYYNGFSYKSTSRVMKMSKGAMTVMKRQKLVGNIYKLLGTIIVGGVAIVESESDNTVLWHMRLGHMVQFKTATHKTEGFLDYVHTNVWGQVYFMRHKSEMFAKFKVWKAEVENQTGRKIKCLKSDNGTEYTNSEFMELCEQHRIKRHFTIQAVNMACYLINKSPRATLDRKVAEEVWTGSPVDYSSLRVFRCPTYVHIPNEERSKFDAKSSQCIFLGERGESSGDPTTFQVTIHNQKKSRWMSAMVKEIQSLHKNQTWDLVELPEGKRAIEWV